MHRLHKQRKYVKYTFNLYKNDLDADRSYSRDDHIVNDHYKTNTTKEI